MLDESEVIKWGTEIFKRLMAECEENEKRYPSNRQDWPVGFNISGARFYRWGMRKGIAVASNAINPYDPYNPSHHDGMRIALWINDQLDALDEVLAIEPNGEIPDYMIDDDATMIKIYNDILSIPTSPLYPYVPAWYLERLAITKQAYEKRCESYIKSLKLVEMRKSPKHGFVYLIQSSTGSYKIGRTKDPDDRMRTFNVKLPFEVDYVCTIESADMYALESQLHRQYGNKRINGEWFALDSNDVASIRGLAVQA